MNIEDLLPPDENGVKKRRRSRTLSRTLSTVSSASNSARTRTKSIREEREQKAEISNSTLLVLVFLSGVGVASIILILPEYLAAMRLRPGGQINNRFPDLTHLSIVEENYFLGQRSERPTTQLQKQKSREVSECTAEAFKSLEAAMSSQKKKQKARALKLFKHAFNLCPKHPKVLNAYGEYIETTDAVVEADGLFVRALAYSNSDSEEHQRAELNRKRTAILVEEIDARMLQNIDGRKRAFQRINSESAALRRAKKEAYFQHIHHSVGIEGNTMTLAQTRSVLETKLAVAGKSVMEHNEVLGLDSALRYVNQTLVDKIGEISLEDILQIHKRVIGYVDPHEAGMIRTTQVYVGDYVPPSPEDIEPLMEAFVQWLNSMEAKRDLMHPVRFAALAHYKLVFIHPFADGNGRTSRLLMNLILMQSGYPPVIIRKQDRLQYYQALVGERASGANR